MGPFVEIKAALAAASALIILSACSGGSLQHLPPEQRLEAKERRERCDELARGLRPSHDRSGGFSILGTGINFRDSAQSQTGARDQYLAALSDLLISCRSWQKFEISSDQFLEDRLKFSTVYTASIDETGDRESRERVIAALARVEGAGAGPTLDAAIARLEQASRAWSPPADITQQLALIADRLGVLEGRETVGAGEAGGSEQPPTGPAGDPSRHLAGATQAASLQFGSGDTALDGGIVDQIAALSPRLSRAPVLVIGFADRRGMAAANATLSLARAKAVADELQRNGVTVSHVAGAGETDELGPRLEDNRVVVILTTRP